ncbi:MAG: N-acetylmuramoyl-L-alanine amidase, partial [Candidatus Firestonebacteria bacterium]
MNMHKYIKHRITFFVVMVMNIILSVCAIAQEKELSGVKIGIDGGHDNTHSSSGYKGGKPGEEWYTLQVAELLRWYLQQYEGAEVYMTRSTGECSNKLYPEEEISSGKCAARRSKKVKKFNPDYFISLHYEANPGTQVYYRHQNMSFASHISAQLRLSLKTTINTHKADWSDPTKTSGIFKGRNYGFNKGPAILYALKCPAILLEICGKQEDRMLANNWLLTVQDIVKGIKAARRNQGFVTPGNDHADENVSVASSSSAGFTELVEGREAFIVLYNGYPDECEALMNKNKEKTYIASSDEFDLEFVKSKPVLVIPSGGLYGLSDSVFFKTQLEEYVKAGGTLLVFSQQHGYDYGVLPRGEEISAYGWLEDQNCQNASVSIAAEHVMFAGQVVNTPNVNVDGYFTKWPGDATVLLTRTKNLYPSMFMYPYGSGKVIVSSLYTDWAYGHSQASTEEIALVRDMISWAKDTTKAIATVKPGESVSVPVEVKYNLVEGETQANASKVKFTVLDADRNIVTTQEQAVEIASGSALAMTVNYGVLSEAKKGIWWIDYELYDVAGNIVQAQSEGERFAVAESRTEGVQPGAWQMWTTSSDSY